MQSKQVEDSYGISGIVRYKKLSPEELEEKVKLAKTGDQIAYGEILSHMHSFLSRLRERYFIQGGDFEDVYQEGAIKLINVIEKFDAKKGKFISFAQRAIEKHIITCINRERAQKRHHLNNAYSLNSTFSTSDDTEEPKTSFIDNLADQDPNEAYSIVQKDYELFLVHEITKVLSRMEAKVFYLRFIQHMSYKEIATELELYREGETGEDALDQKSVDNAIMRSRPKIRKRMEQLGIAPPDLNKIFEIEEKNETKKKTYAKSKRLKSKRPSRSVKEPSNKIKTVKKSKTVKSIKSKSKLKSKIKPKNTKLKSKAKSRGRTRS